MVVGDWLKRFIDKGVLKRSAYVAMIVGPILVAINQGDSVIAGEGLNWTKVVLTFLVPFMVATAVAVGVRRRDGKGTRSDDPIVSCQDAAPGISSGQSSARSSARSSGQSSTPRNGASPLKAKVHVTLKTGVLDPQGKAIENALGSLGFSGVGDVRQGKVIEFTLKEDDPDQARASVEAMCEKLLANTVIENYAIELEG